MIRHFITAALFVATAHAAQAAEQPQAVGIAGTGINVTDMDAQVAFYRDVIGLKVARTLELDNGYETLMSTGEPGAPIFALAKVDNMQPEPGKESYGRLILRVTDNEAMAENIVAAGGSIHSTVDLPGGAKIIFANDPEGFMVELLQAPASE